MITRLQRALHQLLVGALAGVASISLLVTANPLPPTGGGSDLDGDGLPDLEELLAGSDPTKPDTDGDGFNDKAEFDAKTNSRSTNSFPLFLNSVRDHQRLRGDLLAFRPSTLVDFIVTLEILLVTNDPPIDPQPNDPPGPQILMVTNRITNHVAYQWLRDARPIADQTAAGLVLHGARPGDSALYSLRASVLANVQVGRPIKINVPNITPRVPLTQPTGKAQTFGSSSLGLGSPPAGATNLIAVTAGLAHTAGLTAEGTVVVWGGNSLGQANMPAGLSNVIALAAGAAHTLALTADGRVVAWGSSFGASINPPAGLTNVIAIAAGDFHNLALRRDGRVIGWGANTRQQARPPTGLTDVIRIAAGANHSVALTRDGRVICWGANDFGQLATPPGLSGVKIIAAGGNHTIAVRRNGTLQCWGDDTFGQSTPPLRLGPVLAVVAGLEFTAALLPGDRLAVWGGTNSPPVTLTPKKLTNALAVAAGPYHVAVVTRNTDRDQDDLDDSYETALGLRADCADSDLDGLEDANELRLGARADQSDTDGNGVNDLQQLEAEVSPSNDTDEDGLPDLEELRVGSDPLVADTDGDGFNDALEVDAGTSFKDPTLFPLFRNDVKDRQLLVGGTLALRPTLYLTHQVIRTETIEIIPPLPQDPPETPPTLQTNVLFTTNFVTFQWFHQGTPVVGATNPGFFLSLTIMEDAGEYRLDAQLESLVQTGKPIQVEILPREALTSIHGPDVILSTNSSDLILDPELAGVGRLVAWGDAGFLQGRVPAQLADTPVRKIAAGFAHSVALLSTGHVVAWGSDELGQTNQPPGLTNIIAVAAGGGHSLAVNRSGEVIAWGDNRAGQTNVPATARLVVAVSAGHFHSVALRKDGGVVAWGDNTSGQSTVPTTLLARQISAGAFHTAAITPGGLVVCWGDDSAGQSTVPQGLSNVVQVAAGSAHTVARLRDGRVVCWGNPADGRCAVPEGLPPVAAVAAGEKFTAALLATGEPVVWGGAGTEVADQVPPSLTDGFALAAGLSHALALEPFPDEDADGLDDATETDLGLGANTIDTDTDGLTDLNEIRVGTDPRNPDTDGDGLNDFVEIQYGFDPTRSDAAVPGTFRFELAQEMDFFAAQPGTYVLHVTTNGLALPETIVTLELAGGHTRQLFPGRANETTVHLVSPQRAAPAPGVVGNVLVWGAAELLASRQAPLDAPGIIEIAAGPRHTVARVSDGSVRCWGRNEEGECAVPAGLSGVIGVAAGAAHSVAVQQDGRVFAWGRNTGGQASVPSSLGRAVAVSAGGAVSAAVLATGQLALWGDNQFGQLNAAAAIGTAQVDSVSIGGTHAAAVLTDGRVVCWGSNELGQCNVPSGLPAARAVVAADLRTVVLLADGTVRCWGADDTGACRPPAGLSAAIQVAAGFRHSAALRRDGAVVVWGETGPQLTLPARLFKPTAIAAGGNHFYAVNSYEDIDGDSVDDAYERFRRMDPTRRDTDSDGLEDASELAGGFNPLAPSEAPDGAVTRRSAARLTVFTLPTQVFQVEASSDLVNWVPVLTPLSSARGYQSQLVSGGDSEVRFFRSRQLVNPAP